jgi:DNA polymerase
LGLRARELTDGFLDSAMQRDRLLDFVFAEHGVGFADLRGATLDKFLSREDVDPALRDLLNVRVQASTTSTAKYKTLDKVVSSDGRLRGTKQFCGASRTGRWSGKLFQPDNLPRPTLSAEEVEIGIVALKGDCVDLAFENPLAVASSALRSVIIAPPGKKLVVADLSNIEGRGLAWLAGEEWLLQAFRDFDAGVGPDIYKLSYAKSFGITPDEVTKAQRQIGKTQTLALGYAGGISAFVTFALAYGIDLDKMAEDAWPALPDEKIREAEDFLEWQATRKDAKVFPISHRAQVTCEVFKRLWREAHPHIVAWWRELEDAMRTAIDSPGRTVQGVNFKARRDGAWVRLRLPSGRFLCYPQPRIDDNEITYAGTNQFTRKWERVKTYSGKLAENMTQAFARDVMGANMPRIDEAGYETILTVHDEVITEAPDTDDYNAEHLSELLAATPPWGAGMPLAAAGFEAKTYRKD